VESEAKYTIVGIAVVIISLCLVFAVVWLTGADNRTPMKRYTVYFKNQTLDGLQQGGLVTMKGIKVGSVVNLAIDNANIELVKVGLELDDTTPVKEDTKAVINRNLLTGLAIIDLVGSSKESPLLNNKFENEPFPVIPEGRSKLDVVTASLPELIKDVDQMVQHVNGYLSDENKRSFEQILTNFASLSKVLSDEGLNIKEILANLNGVSSDVRDVTKSLSKLAKTGDEKAKEYSELLSSILSKLELMTTNLEKESTSVTTTLQSSMQVITQDINTMSRAVEDGSQSITKMAEGVVDLRSTIFGPQTNHLGPGEREVIIKEER
jgi:phospholipid/cholesterol/gamma-HCH transport system substrate-binding protein